MLIDSESCDANEAQAGLKEKAVQGERLSAWAPERVMQQSEPASK